MHAIESVLCQTYKNLELIVSNDASADKTCAVVQKMADARIQLIKRSKNGGVAAARNSAIRVATGRYIAFLDADDYWLPHKLSTQIAKMQEKAVDFSFTSYIAKSKRGETLIDVPEQIGYKALLKGDIISSSTVIYDTKILGKVYMPELEMSEDFATWLNMLRRCGTALGIRQPMTYVIKHDDSLSARLIKAKYLTYRMYRETQNLSSPAALYCLCWHSLRALRKYSRQFHWLR